jgi:hypothetical protein
MRDLTRWAVVSRERWLTPSGQIEVHATAVTKREAETFKSILSPGRRYANPLVVVRKDTLS